MKKKLLLITSLYPSIENKVRGIFVKEQVALLADIYEVKVVAIEFPGKLSYKHEILENIPVYYITFPILKKFFPSSILMYFIFALFPILRAIRSWKPDIIHLHDYKHFPEAFCTKFILDHLKIPKFITLHNIKSKPGLLNSKYTDWIYSITQEKAYSNWNTIFAVNKKISDYVSKYNRNVILIGNGIREIEEISNFKIDEIITLKPGLFHILSIGNLIKSKGFDLLIEAVSEINSEDKIIQVVIIGSGSERERLEEQIRNTNQEENISIIEQMDNRIVRNIYKYFDAFVLPSWSETFGIVYLEAMYSGLPVIGVETQGVWDLFKKDEEALFIRPRDVVDLTNKIELLRTNTELRIEITKHGQTKVMKEYMLENIIKKIISRYEEN